MTDYTGSWLTKPRLGRQDVAEVAVGKISWTSALASADTLTIADLVPFGQKMIVDGIRIFGTIPDTNATQTTALKAGVTGDDDAFLAATVTNQRQQLQLFGTGASIGVTEIEGVKDLIITVTANAATGVASGDLFVEVTYRSRT